MIKNICYRAYASRIFFNEDQNKSANQTIYQMVANTSNSYSYNETIDVNSPKSKGNLCHFLMLGLPGK